MSQPFSVHILNPHLPSHSAGDPGQGSRIVSKFNTIDSKLRQCAYMFPKADGAPGDYSLDTKVASNNVVNEGWNLMVRSLLTLCSA